MEKNNYFTKVRGAYRLMEDQMPIHAYHNPDHAKDVFYAASRIAKLEGVSYEDRFILATAALLHDIVFVIRAKDNEEKSVELAKPYLVQLSYSQDQINKISELILATKMPTAPKNLLEMIICDSDVDNLGRSDCIKKGYCVKQEIGITDNKTWDEMQLKFLLINKYYTRSAQELRSDGVKQNIKQLEEKLKAYAGGASP